MIVPIAVSEIMQTPVETIDPDESVRAAATHLVDSEIGSLIVCEGTEPVGILTNEDVAELVADGYDPETTTVREIRTRPCITVEESASIETAAERLRSEGIKRLPVVDESGDLVGIVTTTDLSQFIPHLARRGRDQRPASDQATRGIRTDTAYENEDWSYEYVGDDGQIDVGDRITFSKNLDVEDVRAFAEATGDTNRLHLDPPFAERTRFGEPIAHGTLVAGLISAALARLPGLTIYLSQDLSFLGPVSIGDRVTAECAVVEQIGKQQFRLTTSVTGPEDTEVIDGEAVVISDPIPDDAE